MSETSYEFAIVCEAQADRDTACGLADRVLLEEVSWLEPELLDSCRQWRGRRSEEPFLKWASVRSEVQQLGLRLFGKFNGEPGAPDALAGRRALVLLATSERPLDAVLLVRDSDGEPERRKGLEQARNDKPWPFLVILGVAEAKRECWVLAGFDPRDAREAEQLNKTETRLSFHPVRAAHCLTAREHGAKNDAKRALEELSRGDVDRQHACLVETPLKVLEERGQKTGLTDYLKEIRERLVPIVRGRG
jgi:hypothetical protein